MLIDSQQEAPTTAQEAVTAMVPSVQEPEATVLPSVHVVAQVPTTAVLQSVLAASDHAASS